MLRNNTIEDLPLYDAIHCGPGSSEAITLLGAALGRGGWVVLGGVLAIIAGSMSRRTV